MFRLSAKQRPSSAAAILAIPFLLAACAEEPEKKAAAPFTGRVETVALQNIAETTALAGTVRAGTIAPLSARVMGDVVAVHVQEGDRVRAGQLLIEIDGREIGAQLDRARAGTDEARNALAGAEAAVDAAEAQARLAEATFKRYEALRLRGSASAQEFDEMRSRREAAAAQAERARRSRDQVRASMRGASAATIQAETFAAYTKIRAPIDGIVTARHVDPGAQAAPGMPLLVVESTDSVRVETTVDEATPVRAGDAAFVDIGSRRIPAKVTQVVASIDPGTRTSLVKLALSDRAGVRSGSYARVLLATGTRSALTVPAAAIVKRGQLSTVFVVGDDGAPRLRLITLGERSAETVEVLSGLTAGEKVVIERGTA
jgi:multidrug efflux pump subunit AcrA (membrane-fusion protein)